MTVELESREERERSEAADNPVLLELEIMVAKHDIVCRYAGAPTTILKGSQVLYGDRIVREDPDAWELTYLRVSR